MHESLQAAAFAEISVQSALRLGVQTLARLEISDAAIDARKLLIFALNADVLELVKHPGRILSAVEAERFATALARRSAGEPVSRILGWRGFYGRTFAITPATLDPRPESETLIDVALKLTAEQFPNGAGLEIIDIGTGSGCLLVTLLAELPAARGVGVDVSPAALAVARKNAERLGVADRCQWMQGSCFAGLPRRFALVVSNPPYIPAAEIEGLAREVRQFDPRGALDGGADGLDIYRQIAADLDAHMAPGWAVFEAGDGQADAISDIMRSAIPSHHMSTIQVFPDMASKQRCVAVRILN